MHPRLSLFWRIIKLAPQDDMQVVERHGARENDELDCATAAAAHWGTRLSMLDEFPGHHFRKGPYRSPPRLSHRTIPKKMSNQNRCAKIAPAMNTIMRQPSLP